MHADGDVGQQSRNWMTMLQRQTSSGGTHQGNELTCNSSGNACQQLSQLTEPLRTDPWPVEMLMS